MHTVSIHPGSLRPLPRLAAGESFEDGFNICFAFGAVSGWDAAVVTRYPSAEALAQMWLDPRFVAAHNNRVDGVERSQVFVFAE